MKSGTIVIVIIVLLFIGFFAWKARHPIVSIPIDTETASIKGCYIATSGNDTYTLSISTQTDTGITGTLSFNNFQKDSSSGSIVGTYRNGILLADYSFRSEGMDSVMQVIFKKIGEDFLRGYGHINTDGTTFTDISTVTYDPASPLSLFKKSSCPEPISSRVLFPSGGEHLVAGKTYTLLWSGGTDPVQVFLIDTALKSAGVSVSISDRIYNLKNTGSYSYTIPKTMKPGIYELQIGDTTSDTFTIGS